MFGKIGSYPGNPLFVDNATTDMARISYARIYVEIEATREILEFVPLVNENGEEFLQKVECEWKPPKSRRVWKPKVELEVPNSENVVIVEKEERNIPPLEECDSIIDKITPQEVTLPTTAVNVDNQFAILNEAMQNDTNNVGESISKVAQVGEEDCMGRALVRG
ncbi:hypothetical protein LIER_38196 [Lithospermum erythrorhizon]|uniref:Uncharacterized protein n=1 Tax=Lithospermum erythrorhizon TaxID=34254 RepID=A0AAV3PW13_LITER